MMPNSIQTVLDQVAKKVVPSMAERERMSQLAERLKGQVQNILDKRGIGGNVSIQGSFARDTWLSGEADLDIFAAFPPTMDRREWTGRLEKRNRQDTIPYRIHERASDERNASRGSAHKTVHEGNTILRRRDQSRRIQWNACRNPDPALPIISRDNSSSFEMEAHHHS